MDSNLNNNDILNDLDMVHVIVDYHLNLGNTNRWQILDTLVMFFVVHVTYLHVLGKHRWLIHRIVVRLCMHLRLDIYMLGILAILLLCNKLHLLDVELLFRMVQIVLVFLVSIAGFEVVFVVEYYSVVNLCCVKFLRKETKKFWKKKEKGKRNERKEI